MTAEPIARHGHGGTTTPETFQEIFLRLRQERAEAWAEANEQFSKFMRSLLPLRRP